MSTQTVMARLQLNWAEVSGIARALQFTMLTVPDVADMPIVYPVQLGAMDTSVPNAGGEAGEYEVIRKYVYRVLYAPSSMASMDSGSVGSAVDATAIAIIDNAIDYFIQHPRLHTNALGLGSELGLLTRDVAVSDSGIVPRLGPDGTQYRATDYTLIIGERRFPSAAFIS